MAQDEKDGDVQVVRDDIVAKRQGQKGQERAAKGDIRADTKESLIGICRNDIFFHQQLHAVGDGLEPAEFSADARGTEAILNSPRDLSLQPNKEDRRQGHKPNQDARRNYRHNELGEPWIHIGREPIHHVRWPFIASASAAREVARRPGTLLARTSGGAPTPRFRVHRSIQFP